VWKERLRTAAIIKTDVLVGEDEESVLTATSTPVITSHLRARKDDFSPTRYHEKIPPVGGKWLITLTKVRPVSLIYIFCDDVLSLQFLLYRSLMRCRWAR
jgi:hypothetical protein